MNPLALTGARGWGLVAGLIAALASDWPEASQAADFNVPSIDYPTIQEAVDAAAAGGAAENFIQLQAERFDLHGEITIDAGFDADHTLVIRPDPGIGALRRVTLANDNGFQPIIRIESVGAVTLQDLDLIRHTTNHRNLLEIWHGDNVIVERCRVGSDWPVAGDEGYANIYIEDAQPVIVRNTFCFAYAAGTLDAGIRVDTPTAMNNLVYLYNNTVADHRLYGVDIKSRGDSALVLRNNVVVNRVGLEPEPFAYRADVEPLVQVFSRYNTAFASPPNVELIVLNPGESIIGAEGFLLLPRATAADAFLETHWIVEPLWHPNPHFHRLRLGGPLHNLETDAGVNVRNQEPEGIDLPVTDDWEKDPRPSGDPERTDRGADQVTLPAIADLEVLWPRIPVFTGASIGVLDDDGIEIIAVGPQEDIPIFQEGEAMRGGDFSVSGAFASIATPRLVSLSPPPAVPRSTYYDGTPGAMVEFPAAISFDPAPAMTIEAWVFREDTNRVETIVSHDRSRSFWFGFNGPWLHFQRGPGQGANSDRAVAAHRWTHVAAAYDGSRVWFYIDGEAAGSATLGAGPARQGLPLRLGGDPTGLNFLGYLDEVRLWPVRRTQEDIRRSMSDPLGPQPGLAGLFPSGGPWEANGALAGAAGPGAIGRNVGGFLREPLQIPRAFWPMTVDGQVDPENEYLGAAQIMIHYDEGPDAIAYLVHEGEAGNGNLYVALTGLRLPVGRDPALSWVAVGLDPRGSQSALASPFHLQLRGFLDGAPPLLFRGDGLGGFDYFDNVPGPNALWEVRYDNIEYHLPDVEFRITKSLDWLWRDTNGLMIGHFDVAVAADNYLAPNGTVWNSPATWPVATYVENSVVTPRAVFSGQVFNHYRANPIRNHPVRVIQDSDGFELARVLTDNDGAFLISTWVPANQPLRLEVGELPHGLYLRSDVSQHDIQPQSSSARWAVFPGAEPGVNAYAPVDFYLRQPIGPISLTDYHPRGTPAEKLVPDDPAARVKIFGANLHNQSQVYLYGCLDLDRQNGPSVPLGCLAGEDYFEARIVSRAGDESWVEVEVPPVPVAHRNPSGWWGWAVRDNWDRPERAGAVWTRVGGAPDNHFDLRVARVGGARPLLVILVEYEDRTFSNANYYANYAGRIFGPAEPNVSAYYRETSHGLFTYLPATAGDQDGTADGLVMVQMPVSQSNAPRGGDYRRQALALADSVFDFSRYDANGNGRIEDHELGVLVIQANGGPSGVTDQADAGSGDGVELGGLGVAVLSEDASNYTLYHELAHLVEFHGITGRDPYNNRDAFLQTVVVWSLDNQGAITRREQVGGEIALELDAAAFGQGGAVAAYRDQNGELSLAAYDLSDPDFPRAEGLARAGLASDLSICQVSPTRVLTALQSGGGNLKLIVWEMNAELEFARKGDYTPEPASDIDVTAVSSSRVVAAFRNAEGQLKLMVLDLTAEGDLELRGWTNAGGATEINLVNLGEDRVITALRVPDSGDLKLICYDLAADGSLARRGDYQAGAAQDIDLAVVGQRRVAASVRTASSFCKVVLFEVDAAGNFARLGSYEDEDGEMVAETRNSIPGEIYPSQPMTAVGVAGARIVFAYIRTNHSMRLRTLDIQADGRLTLAGGGETSGSARSVKIVPQDSSQLATITRNDGQIWTGKEFAMLGTTVAHFDPCTKHKLGWLPYTTALRSGTYELSPMGTEGAEALIIRNPCHRETEYFIVEVRTRESRYESVADQGLAIWHIDEAKVYPEPYVSLEWLGGSQTRALWAATDIALTVYDDSSAPAGSRWSDFTPSGIAIRGVTAVGNRLSFEVSVPLCLEDLRILRSGGGAMLTEFFGNPGRIYRIEYSHDLKSWATLTTITADALGRGRYLDTSAVSAPARFYRLVAP